MSNSNGDGLNSIGNSSWTKNLSGIERRDNIQDRLDAAQKRTNAMKAKLLADNKSVNNDTMSVKSNESKFITDYKSQTTRWTTNTATTRFFPPKQDDDNDNTNVNNDNTNANTSSIDSRLFTDSFLQTHNNDNNDNINSNRNTSNTNQHYQQFQSIQHQSNHPIPQLPLPHKQQLQASNTALLTQSHSQPQRSHVNVNQNQSINIQNPMLSINTHNTDQLAQQRHANRIFHAADSTHGKYQPQAQRLPSESSFGIQAPLSVVSTHLTTQSQRDFPPKHSNIERAAPRSRNHN